MPASSALLKKLDDLAEKEDWNAIIQIVCKEIASAKNGKSIEALEHAETIEESFLGEADAGAEIADAILKRAFALRGAGGADILRMLNVIALYQHAEPLAIQPPKTSYRKAEVLQAVENSLPLLREGITDKNAAFRTATLYLLLTCHHTGSEDAQAILQLLAKEKDSATRLTALLALGVIGRRLPAKDPIRVECVNAVEAESKKKYPATFAALATACVANASSMLEIPWNKTLVASVKSSMKKPALVPAAWGFPKNANSLEIIMPALSVQPSSTLEPLVEGIAKMGTDATQLLFGLAFGDMPAAICDGLGVVIQDLNPLQLRVLTAFTDPSFAREYSLQPALNIWNISDLKNILAAQKANWKAIPVKTNTGVRELAPCIIWRMTSRGMIEVKDAFDALIKHLSIAELADIVLKSPDAVRPYNALKEEAEKKRNMDLCHEVIVYLENKDPEWATHVRNAPKSDGPYIDTLIGYSLLRLVKQKKITLEEEDRKYIQMAVLHAMNTPYLYLEYIPLVPPEIRDWMIEHAVPSSLKEITAFLAKHPYQG